RGVVDDAGADWVPGAAIGHEIIAKRQDAAGLIEADLEVVDLVARMRGGEEVLAAVLDPAHGPPELAGEEGDQEVLGVDVALDAEAAADVGRHAAHARFRKAQNARGLAPHPMHDLGRGPDDHRICTRIMYANDASAFHRHAAVAVVIEPALQ